MQPLSIIVIEKTPRREEETEMFLKFRDYLLLVEHIISLSYWSRQELHIEAVFLSLSMSHKYGKYIKSVLG